LGLWATNFIDYYENHGMLIDDMSKHKDYFQNQAKLME